MTPDVIDIENPADEPRGRPVDDDTQLHRGVEKPLAEPLISSYLVGVLVLTSTLGVAMIVIGSFFIVEPDATQAYEGPSQCVVISSARLWTPDVLCGAMEERPNIDKMLVLARRDNVGQRYRNCTVCESKVACGATSSLPNLVDGTMRVRPFNQSGGLCELPGHLFEGYYRQATGGGLEMKLAVDIEKQHQIHQALHGFAALILSTGGLSLLASLSYAVYALCTRTAVNEPMSVQVSYTDCWGPNPAWRSEYTMVRGGGHTGKYGGGGKNETECCHVCLSASAGSVQFVGCGHAVVCLTCSGLLRHCPVCGERIDGIRIDEQLML